jgi:predicted acylesterase/phospholipase RssA
MIDTIIFGGGGPRGIAYMGALIELEKQKVLKLDEIQEFIGTSIGAVFAGLLAVGYTFTEVIELSYQIKYKQVLSFPFSEEDSLLQKCKNILFQLSSKKGFLQASKFKDRLEGFISKKSLQNNLTFQQLFEQTKKKLKIVSCCLTKAHKIEWIAFDHQSTPNMPISKAILISCSIPFIFCPIKDEQGNYWFDGGLLHNVPTILCQSKPLHSVLVLCLNNKKKWKRNLSLQRKLFLWKTKQDSSKINPKLFFDISVWPFKTLHFDLSSDNIDCLVEMGKQYVKFRLKENTV